MLLSIFRWQAKYVKLILCSALLLDKHKLMCWTVRFLAHSILRDGVRLLRDSDSH